MRNYLYDMERNPHQNSRQTLVMATGAPRNRPHNMALGAAPPSLQTNSELHRNVRYSYTATPTEFQRPVFEQSSPADSMIEESPISPKSPQRGNRMDFAERALHSQIPPPQALGPQNGSPYGFQPPHEVHPAHFAPYAQVLEQPDDGRLNLQEPQSPGPLPIKINDEPISPGVAIIPNSEHGQRNTASPVISPNAHPPPLIYDPDSFGGPNASHEAHRPGQVSHPNAVVKPEWKHSLCEIDTLCCTGLICPCIVYGKTQYRLSRKAKKQEPTDLLGYDACNTSCGIMAVACGFQCEHTFGFGRGQLLTLAGVLAALQRNRIRRLYKLNGDLGSDCVKGLCCCCCVIMQDEREVCDREELFRRHAGPAIGAYAAPGTMMYAPPPR